MAVRPSVVACCDRRCLGDKGQNHWTVLDGTRETGTDNSVNELTARTNPSATLTYDNAGNLTQDGDSNGDHKYVWDYRNRLIEAKEKQSGNWVTVGEYKYDARNRRIRKVMTNKGSLNGTTRFVWGGDSDWQCLEERDGSGDLVARFTYAPGYIDSVAVQERDLNSDDDFADTNEVVYYHSNTLYSIYALSDSSGTVVERYRYDAYGAATVLDADGSDDSDNASDVHNPYLFTARRLDPESGLMQYRYRYHSAVLGRFVSRDPTGYTRQYNLYGYVSARPTFSGDPTGLRTYKQCKCYCDKACDVACMFSNFPPCEAACKVYCMALCMLPDPKSKCYKPGGMIDCIVACKSKGGCNLCCHNGFIAGTIKDHSKCQKACKKKPTLPR